jgi:predicted nuclease of predicted toxin-antitoxin system
LKLLLDEMLSPAIAEELRRRGHDTVAIAERADWCGLADSDLLSLGRSEGRAIVTKNIRDFRPLAAEAMLGGGPGHAGVVFVAANISLSKAATGRLVEALEAKG